jgi:glycine cleavage system H protein
MDTVRFRHAHFSARFPVGHRYTPSHFWLARTETAAGDVWRVGMTKFATRMLGELVEMVLDVVPGQRVDGGQRLGTVEGFKAVSDLYCVMEGEFIEANPLLRTESCLAHTDPHGDGWLYAVRGAPAAGDSDVHGYVVFLTETVDRLHASRYSGSGPTADSGDGPPAS